MKHIGDLNTSNFFCKGCGMMRNENGDECPQCRLLRLPVETFPLPVIGIFVLAAIVFVVGVWIVSQI